MKRLFNIMSYYAAGNKQPTTYLPIAYLPIAYCLLPIAYRLLPIAYRLLAFPKDLTN